MTDRKPLTGPGARIPIVRLIPLAALASLSSACAALYAPTTHAPPHESGAIARERRSVAREPIEGPIDRACARYVRERRRAELADDADLAAYGDRFCELSGAHEGRFTAGDVRWIDRITDRLAHERKNL